MTKGKYKRKREHAKQHAQQNKHGLLLSDPDVVSTKKQPESAKESKTLSDKKQEPFMGFREAVKKSSFTDWCIAAFTLVLAGTSIYQFNAMSGQLSVMQQDERPWVGIKEFSQVPNPQPNVPLQVWISLGNLGKSPAFLKEQVTELRLIPGAFPDTIEFKEPPPPGYDKEAEPIFPNDVGFKQMVSITLSADDIKDITLSRKTLYLFGRVKYTDSTDPSTVHTTRFCWSVGSAPSAIIGGVQTSNVVMVGCHGKWSYAD